jgi:uncharacterized protein YcfL
MKLIALGLIASLLTLVSCRSNQAQQQIPQQGMVVPTK